MILVQSAVCCSVLANVNGEMVVDNEKAYLEKIHDHLVGKSHVHSQW